MRLKFLILLVSINTAVFSQESYELLFLRGEFDKLFDASKDLAGANDYYWNALALDKKGETLRAINVLKEGQSKYAKESLLENLLIDLLYKTGQFPQVKPLLVRYLDDQQAFLKYVNILGFESIYQEAINHLNARIVSDTANIEYLSLLGEYYYQLDSLAASIEVLERLIVVNPADQKNLNKLANMYVRNKNYTDAIGICDRVLSQDSLNRRFNRTKGIACFNISNFKLAKNCFLNLLEQGDTGKFVLKNLGISEFKCESVHSAREHLLMAFALDSADFEINYYLGKAYLESPTPEAGLYYLDRAESLLQPVPSMLATLYLDKQALYSAMGNYNEALRCFQTAYQHNPKPEYIFFIASLCHHHLKDKKKAMEYYEEFIAKLPPRSGLEGLYDQSKLTGSLRKVAESNITSLKEELFFNGELGGWVE